MEHPRTLSRSTVQNIQEEDCEITWKHPGHFFQRLLALFLMCLIGFGKLLFSCIFNCF